MDTKESTVDFSLVLASSVHDMKNSVGMLVASIENIIEAQPPTNPEQAQRFNTLHYEASRINGELVQLLTIYRMQNNRLPLRIDHHFVSDMLEEQFARNHGLVESKNIEIALHCDDSLQWYFDVDLIGSVIQNVIVNCCRYTRTRIEVHAQKRDGQLEILIADDGEGYPESMLNGLEEHLDEVNVNDGGTRLGLYFAQQIAKLHQSEGKQGEVSVTNGKPLSGGCFVITVP